MVQLVFCCTSAELSGSCRLEIIGKLVYNSACAPTEAKYKAIKTTNKKIKDVVIDAPGGMEVLSLLGWVEADSGEELKCTKTMTMAQVRILEIATL